MQGSVLIRVPLPNHFVNQITIVPQFSLSYYFLLYHLTATYLSALYPSKCPSLVNYDPTDLNLSDNPVWMDFIGKILLITAECLAYPYHQHFRIHNLIPPFPPMCLMKIISIHLSLKANRNVLLKLLESVWMKGYIKMYKMLNFLINTAQKRYL